MDWHSNNCIEQERKYFFAKIKSNPIFLFRHCLSLFSMLWEQGRTKYLIKLRGCHQGAKIRPPWLKEKNKFQKRHIIYHSAAWSMIPERVLPANLSYVSAYSKTQETSDLEDYLATHRWSNLIKDILSGIQPTLLPIEINNWIAHPPKKQDPAWETYSTCERVANLLTWMSFIPINQRSSIMTPNICFFLEESIQWIAEHLEFYKGKTNNHIINNARALIMGGVVLHHQAAIDAGILILHQMLPILIQANGSLRERSTHYQLIVLTWLLDIEAFMQVSKYDTFITWLKKIIYLIRNVALSFCDNAGNLYIHIGDISPDISPTHTGKRLNMCYPKYWPDTKPSLTDAPYLKTEKNSVLVQDDWWILFSQQHQVVLNCPTGNYPISYPSHSHGDITSFVWLYNEEPILIDSGRHRYIKDNISILQKSARGHTVPLVNGFSPLCESFVICGNWWPTPYASAKIKISSQQSNNIILSHNGFRRATPIKSHEREIILLENKIKIRDTFKGQGKVHINSIWQLSPIFTQFDNDRLIINSQKITIEVQVDAIQSPLLLKYDADNWYSHQYGLAKSNPKLSIQWEVNLPFESIITLKVKTCAA